MALILWIYVLIIVQAASHVVQTFHPLKAKHIALKFRGGGNDDAGDSASIQYMITRKMRSILEEDLKYLEEEVDEMEPQIARVVIERRLQRPVKGMPASWRRTGDSVSATRGANGAPNPLYAMASAMKNTLGNIAEVAPFLKLAAVPLAVYLAGRRFPVFLPGVISNVKSAIDVGSMQERAASVSKKVMKKKPSSSASASSPSNVEVDPRALGSVRRQTPFGLKWGKSWKRN